MSILGVDHPSMCCVLGTAQLQVQGAELDANQALFEALAYLDSLKEVAISERVALLTDRLKARGYAVQAAPASILNDCSPASLQRARQALGLTIGQLAQAAGLQAHTVSSAELGTKKPHATTIRAITGALVDLEVKVREDRAARSASV